MRSVSAPKSVAPKKMPINDAAPMSPTSALDGIRSALMPTSATPMMLSTNPSRNGPPQQAINNFRWKRDVGASSMTSKDFIVSVLEVSQPRPGDGPERN